MKVIAIISQKGGSGKTTISTHLAVAAEQRGYQTALFDLDPQASAANWADRREAVTPVVVPAQASRLPSLLKQAAAQEADLVIIDSAPNADVASVAAVRAADLIIIPCRPATFDLDAVGATLSLASVAKKPAYVLLNAVAPVGKIGEEARAALEAGGVEVVPRMIHNLVAFSYAVNDGRTAQEYDAKGKAAKEVDVLFKWASDTLGLQAGKQTKSPVRKRA